MDDKPAETRPGARSRAYRSVFWPIVLIGAGAVLLLDNLGMVQIENPWSLLRFAPLLLIVAGLDMIFARSWPAVGAILGLLVVAALVLLLVAGPRYGLVADDAWPLEKADPPGWLRSAGFGDVQHGTYSTALDGVEIAEIEIGLGATPANIYSLGDSDRLITAELDHVRDIRFDVSGGERRHVRLDEAPDSGFTLSLWVQPKRSLSWDIGLHPEVPIDLVVDASSGDVSLDLQETSLRRLSYDASSGKLGARLPVTVREIAYEASSGAAQFVLAPETEAEMTVDMSSGALEIEVGDDSNLDLVVTDASSGEIRIALPKHTAAMVDVRDSSSGAVHVPPHYVQVRKTGEDEGIWRTSHYAEAARRVTIVVESMSSGDLVVVER